MSSRRQLFILVSQTHTGIARLIRGVCNYPYNHVSVTLDPSLRRWYSFARYVQDAPLYETLTVNGRNYILVHAGLGNFRPGRPLDDYTPEELLMDRPAPEDRYFSNARVILGHTPAGFFDPEHPNRAFRTETWTCIDTGAAAGGFAYDTADCNNFSTRA